MTFIPDYLSLNAVAAAVCFVIFEASFWYCADSLVSHFSMVCLLGVLFSVMWFALFVQFSAMTVKEVMRG